MGSRGSNEGQFLPGSAHEHNLRGLQPQHEPSSFTSPHLEHLWPAVKAQRVGGQSVGSIVPQDGLCGAPGAWGMAYLPGTQVGLLKAALARTLCRGARPVGGGVALRKLQRGGAAGRLRTDYSWVLAGARAASSHGSKEAGQTSAQLVGYKPRRLQQLLGPTSAKDTTS